MRWYQRYLTPHPEQCRRAGATVGRRQVQERSITVCTDPDRRFQAAVVAAVLVPLGIWLALTQPSRPQHPDRPARLITVPVLVILAAAVGCVVGAKLFGLPDGTCSA